MFRSSKTIIPTGPWFHKTSDIEFKKKAFIHLGSLEQAKMRSGLVSKRILVFQLIPGLTFFRMRDKGSWNTENLKKMTSRYDGIVYLNRFEGIPLNEFDQCKNEPDELSDNCFRKHMPSASDSIIVFNPINIKFVGEYDIEDKIEHIVQEEMHP